MGRDGRSLARDRRPAARYSLGGRRLAGRTEAGPRALSPAALSGRAKGLGREAAAVARWLD